MNESNNESTLTLKFKGVEADILNKMVKSGLFNTKSEAIRSALVHYSMDFGFFDKRKLWQDIKKIPKRRVSASQLIKDIREIKEAK